jgi:hypothetical protein
MYELYGLTEEEIKIVEFGSNGIDELTAGKLSTTSRKQAVGVCS